ncbi:MAG: hypothetical protein HFE41_01015 [Clostridia bacterium]|jgi:hypothetical protein|nr:hypothetical protein [Clostridia bacterium]
MRKAKQERKRRRRKWLRIILEITFMACGILGTRLPEPYDIYALLTLGALRIILSAVQRERKAEEPPAIVYCNGEKEPQPDKPAKAVKTAHIRGATAKPAPQIPANIKQPVKAAKTTHITGANTKKGVKTI